MVITGRTTINVRTANTVSVVSARPSHQPRRSWITLAANQRHINSNPPAMTDIVSIRDSTADQTRLVIGASGSLPALVIAAGERAGIRFLEFFASNIRNPNTRRAYARAVSEFMAWCAHAGVMSVNRSATAARGSLDRIADTDFVGADGQAAACGNPEFV
jgi:hypothetical protein